LTNKAKIIIIIKCAANTPIKIIKFECMGCNIGYVLKLEEFARNI
jgi:hypothetical protein